MQNGDDRFATRGVLRRLGTMLCFTVFYASTGSEAAPDERPDRIDPPRETLSTPLHFKRHNFLATCYDTLECSVSYNGRYQARQAPGTAPTPKPDGDYRKRWSSPELGIRNFPAPADVRWRSRDGEPHHAQVDLRQIFKEELIWHRLAKDQMTDFYSGPVAGSPDIYLEVDDRTISVYTAMFIPIREEQIPGNKDSDFRKDVFLVWSRSY